MLTDEMSDYLSHAAQEFMRARAEGVRTVVVMDLADGIDEHDVYALLALNAEDPAVIQVGLSSVEKGERAMPTPESGQRIDWEKDKIVDG